MIHADPDDWVEPDMLEELYKKAKEEVVDMVICDPLLLKGKIHNRMKVFLCIVAMGLKWSSYNMYVVLRYTKSLFINSCI